MCVKYSIWSSCMHILPISVWRKLKLMCIKKGEGERLPLCSDHSVEYVCACIYRCKALSSSL